jgi:hypothetical protein
MSEEKVSTPEQPFRVSWSSLLNWEMCKQKGWQMSQRRSSPLKDSRNFFHGTVVDRIMRNWLADPQPGMMPKMVDEYMESSEKEGLEHGDGVVKWRHKTDKSDVRKFCVELTKRLEPILSELVLPYDYEPAKRFKIPMTLPGIDGEPTEILMTGEYDLLVRNHEKNFHVWDLKATADNNYWKKTLGQLVFYDLATMALMGEAPTKTGLIQPMCDERVVEFSFTDDDRRAMLARIMAMMRSVWFKDHAPKSDSTGCYFCPVRAACEKYKKPDLMGIGSLV